MQIDRNLMKQQLETTACDSTTVSSIKMSEKTFFFHAWDLKIVTENKMGWIFVQSGTGISCESSFLKSPYSEAETVSKLVLTPPEPCGRRTSSSWYCSQFLVQFPREGTRLEVCVLTHIYHSVYLQPCRVYRKEGKFSGVLKVFSKYLKEVWSVPTE